MRNSFNNGVSPVVAVILMVAVTVILSAVIGMFVLDLGQSSTESKQSTIGMQSSISNGEYTATVVTGTAERVLVLVDGSIVLNKSGVSPGDRLTVSVSDNSIVTVVELRNGHRYVVSTEEVGSVYSQVPTRGLLSYWTLNGHANDSEGTNDGTVYGATPTSTAVDGDAFDFNGTTDYIQTGDVSYDQTHTFSTWIYSRDVVDNRYVVGDFNNTVDTGSQLFQNTDKVKWLITDSSGSIKVLSAPISNNTWYHVVGTYNGTTSRIYVNGSLVSSGNFSGYSPSNTDVFIGRRVNSNINYFDGVIDDVRIYDRALNKSEVSRLYNSTK